MALGPFHDKQRTVITVQTNADLTGQINRGVEILASFTCRAVLSSTDGVPFAGILEGVDNSSTGAGARVCVSGITEAIAGAAITAGADFILSANNTSGASGYVMPADSASTFGKTGTTYISGYTLESASAASQVISVFMQQRTQTIA